MNSYEFYMTTMNCTWSELDCSL